MRNKQTFIGITIALCILIAGALFIAFGRSKNSAPARQAESASPTQTQAQMQSSIQDILSSGEELSGRLETTNSLISLCSLESRL